MSKQFISFLGTNNYLECNYFFGDEKVEKVKFIQTAVIKIFCNDFDKNDRITIFVTEKAKDFNQNKLRNELKLHNINKVKFVDIPSGNNEEELWELFDVVYKNLQENGDIIFDITHSFRYIPMLSMVLLNYASFLKDINLDGIYYGAFETLGSLNEAKEIPIEKRNAPIFDLTPLSMIQKWTIATQNLVESGNPDKIGKIVENLKDDFYKGKEIFSKEHVDTAKEVKNHLSTFLGELATNRGISLMSGNTPIKTKKLIKELQNLISANNSLLPLNQLSQKIETMVDKFEKVEENDIEGKIKNLLNAIELCIKFNLIQQGITLLRETIIIYVCMKNEIDYRKIDRENKNLNKISRDEVEKLLSVYNYKDVNDWSYPLEKNMERYSKIIKMKKFKELSSTYNSIRNYRNDINHAGIRKNPIKDVKKFKEHLEKTFIEVKKIILE